MTTVLKKFLYNFFNWPISGYLSFFAQATNQSCPMEREARLYLVWTIDVEGGYINRDRTRTWMRNDLESKQGFTGGFKLWLDLFRKHKIQGTFFVSTQGFSLAPSRYKSLIKVALLGDNEVGYHLHLAEDNLIRANLSFTATKNSSKFYTRKNIEEILRSVRSTLAKHMGNNINSNITSFRWGNWGINSIEVFKSLRKFGFTRDSSILPGKAGHFSDDRIFDWRKYKQQDFPKELKGIWEIPVSTFHLFNVTLTADPTYGYLLIEYIRNQLKSVKKSGQSRVIVLFSHSSEIITKNNHRSYIYNLGEQICDLTRESNALEFVTLKDIHEKITRK